MNITAKSRYALKVMMDLAITGAPSTRHDIAKRQGLPVDFMDQIISRLKTAELVKTTRGRMGGLNLNKPASDISLWDIFSSVEDHLFSVVCLSDGCITEDSCLSVDIWKDVYAGFQYQLQEKILADVVKGKSLPTQIEGFISECRAPKKGAPSLESR